MFFADSPHQCTQAINVHSRFEYALEVEISRRFSVIDPFALESSHSQPCAMVGPFPRVFRSALTFRWTDGSEVHQFDITFVVDEDIIGLEVSADDSTGMHVN